MLTVATSGSLGPLNEAHAGFGASARVREWAGEEPTPSAGFHAYRM